MTAMPAQCECMSHAIADVSKISYMVYEYEKATVQGTALQVKEHGVAFVPPLVHIDTSGYASTFKQVKVGSSYANPGESAVIWKYMVWLKDHGVDVSKAAVVSPYKAQVRLGMFQA